MATDKNVHVIDHPLVRHKLSIMRDKNTSTRDFRDLLREISMLLGYELMRDLPTEPRQIETPLETMTADQIALLGYDNVVSAEAQRERRTLLGLGIAPTALETILPTYLWRFRRNGQFERLPA